MYDTRVHSNQGCSSSGQPFQSAWRNQGWNRCPPQQLSSLCPARPIRSGGPGSCCPPRVLGWAKAGDATLYIQQPGPGPAATRTTRLKRRTKQLSVRTCCQAGSASSKQAVREPLHRRLWNYIIDICPPLGSRDVIMRALGTVLVLVIARCGQYVPLKGVDQRLLPDSLRRLSQDELFGLRSSVPANIFMLGIGPLINASIVSGIYMSIHNIQLKPGLEEQAKYKMLINFIALALAVIQGTMLAVRMEGFAFQVPRFVYSTMLTLVGGAATLGYLAGEVEHIGLGNGTTLLIAASILVNEAKTLVIAGRIAMNTSFISPWKLGLALSCLVALVYAALFVSQVEKRYPLVSYKIEGQGSKRDQNRTRNYLPMRLTPSGTAPLLTASFTLQLARGVLSNVPGFGKALAGAMANKYLYPLLFGFLAFTSVVTDLSGGRMARDSGLWMSSAREGVKVTPPVLPGETTAEFLVRQQQLAHFWGGIAVAALAVLAALLDLACTLFLGLSFNAVHMLLLTGFVSTVQRQVASLSEIPKLQRKLDRERALLLSFDS